MKLVKAMIFAAAFALPFTAFGAQAVSPGTAAKAVGHEVNGETPEGYDCCWYYFNGRWYCVNC